MKKHAIVLAALIGAASAQAQVYGTVAGGATHLDMDCTGLATCDTSGTGFKLVGGYDFGNGLSLEAGYMNFGKSKVVDGNVHGAVKPTAFTLGGAYAMPLGSDWGMNVRLGIAQVKTKATATLGATSGSVSESKAKVYAGVGVTYAISKTVKFELGIDSTQAELNDEKGTLRMISLGATFAF